MILADLNAGDVVRIKLSHWPVSRVARVQGRGREHCQLHGDFIDTTIRFQMHKGQNLRASAHGARALRNAEKAGLGFLTTAASRAA